MGYGKVWYGEDEMFGETGKYSFLYKDEYEDSQQVYFKKPYSDYFYRYWYVYKIKLRDDDYTDGQSMTLKDFLANNN